MKKTILFYCFLLTLWIFSCSSEQKRTCLLSDDCMAGEKCVDRACYPEDGKCSKNSDCPYDKQGNICREGKCEVFKGCYSNNGCNYPQTCEGGICKGLGQKCSETSECIKDQQCLRGVCRTTLECIDESGCFGAGEVCINQLCQPPITSSECKSNTDCSSNQVCSSGKCSACVPQCSSKNCGSDGCGGVCGTCTKGFKCSAAGQCSVDLSALWSIVVTHAKISEKTSKGESWDALGGAPDPFICLTINGTRNCSRSVQDTFNPSWNFTVTATGSALQLGVLVELIDEDISEHDKICSGTVPVPDDNFKSGKWEPKCSSGHVFATLSPK